VELPDGKSKDVRAMIDSGADKSYIKESLAQDLRLPVIGKEVLNHNVFGGVSTGAEYHTVYELKLKIKMAPNSKLDSNSVKLEVRSQEKICGTIRRVPTGPWMEELRK